MDPLYVFFHIPRTGGTFFEKSVGGYLDRTSNRFLTHYHYVQGVSDLEYKKANIPLLSKRTTEQQKQLKIITGHSTFCNSHRWLKVNKEPRIISFVRHPIERLLSSFNYRHELSILNQDPEEFSLCTPAMNENAFRQQKTAEDYDTLWEWYQDITYEHNIQCKWLIKNFLKRENDTWYRHPKYVFGPDAGIQEKNAVPMTWPEWMWNPPEGVNWYELASTFFKECWWILPTEEISNNIEDFCNFADLEYLENSPKNNSGDLVEKYWTLDDVMSQPDIEKLLKAEQHDLKLYNHFKNKRRPF